MKLEDIYDLWSEDSKIDEHHLGDEALKVPQLHHKYYKLLSHESLLKRKLEAELKVLKLEKQEFFLLGPSPETQAKGWTLPPSGRVLKPDLGTYIDADKDIIALTLKIGVQAEKLALLESIIKSLHSRNFEIKSWIEFKKFQNGGF